MNWNKAIIITTVILVVIFSGIYIKGSSTPRNLSVNSIEIPSQTLDEVADLQLSDLKKNLRKMTEAGSLEQETSDRILTGAKKYVDDSKQARMSVDAFDLNMTVLKESNLITLEDFETIKAAVEKEVQARKEKAYGPLVKDGIFASTEEAEIAMSAYGEKLSKLLTEQQTALQETLKSASPTLTDEEKNKGIEEFKNAQPQRIEAVLKEMVAAGEITETQSVELEAHLKPSED